MDIVKIHDERARLVNEMRKVLDRAENESRKMRPDEIKENDKCVARIEFLDEKIQRHNEEHKILGTRPEEIRESVAGSPGHSIGRSVAEAVHEVRVGRSAAVWLDPETRERTGSEGRSLTDSGDFGTAFVHDEHGAASLTLRAKSVVLGLPGVRVVPMSSNRMDFPKVGAASVMKGVPELGAITESTFESLDFVTIEAVKFVAYHVFSSEFMEDASSDAYAIVVENVYNSLALAVDESMLEGLGASDLLGIRNTPGINTTAVDGTPTDFDKLSEVLYEAEAANANPAVWLMNPRSWSTLSKIKTGLASDKTTLLEPNPQQGPRTLLGLPVKQSTQITLTEGAGAGSWVAAVDPSQIIVGVRRAPTLEISREPLFASDGVCMKITARYGFGILNPEGISIATDVRA